MLECKQAVTQISLTVCKEALVQGTRGTSLVIDKEGLVTFTRRTSAQAVPVCVRVLTAPPTLYLKFRCGLNTAAGGAGMVASQRHRMSAHLACF